MARQRKALPARKSDRSRDEDSLLIRSVESLGRVIAALQRQLDATGLTAGKRRSSSRASRAVSSKAATTRARKKTSAKNTSAKKR